VAELILQYLRAFFDLLEGLAWPAAILAVALVFRHQISAAIPRIRKAGIAGVELDAEALQAAKPPELTPAISVLGEARPAIKDVEDELQENLKLIESSKQIPLLVRRLALTQAGAYFENTYGLIFGSQIEFLETLSVLGELTEEESRSRFATNYSPRFQGEASGVSYEPWVEFLIARKLVNLTGAKIEITKLGEEFLYYLKANGRSLRKAL
jgi:hypothetical protein